MAYFRAEDLVSRYHGYPAKIGYAIRGSNGTMRTQEHPQSGQWSVKTDRPNAYRVDSKQLQSFHGKKGHIFYRLENNAPSFVNARQKCRDWYEVSTKPLSS